jgi:hypothetical protein
MKGSNYQPGIRPFHGLDMCWLWPVAMPPAIELSPFRAIVIDLREWLFTAKSCDYID